MTESASFFFESKANRLSIKMNKLASEPFLALPVRSSTRSSA